MRELTISFFQSLLVNLSICCMWYAEEYRQFHELQLGRHCDDVVSILYFAVIWYLFYTIQKAEKY